MKILNNFKNSLTETWFILKDDSLESIIWLVNLVPSKAGFSILKDRMSAPFWVIHLSLLFYVYIVNNIIYQIQFAKDTSDYIKCSVNFSLFLLTANNSYWFFKKRSLLKKVLKQVTSNDQLAKQTESLTNNHKKLLSTIKKIILVFYGFNLMDESFIYLPHKADVSNDYYSMTPCIGLEPLTKSPNREICQILLVGQEISIMMVVLNYQALLLLLIAHTGAMYQMLAAEMMLLDKYEETEENKNLIKQRLPLLIKRHCKILQLTENLKSLYSMPIGVNWGSNAVCISMFFYLSIREWITFSPVLIYCFLVFFLYCYLCQRLINASEVFETAIYSCGWEKFGLEEKKTIYFMLLQAQRPVLLLAADIIPVNISTFATTLRGMYQFITVVKL